MTTRAGYIDARPRIIARAIAEVGVAEATGRNDGARVEQYIAARLLATAEYRAEEADARAREAEDWEEPLAFLVRSLQEKLSAQRAFTAGAFIAAAIVAVALLLVLALPAHAEPPRLTEARTAQTLCVLREYRTRTASAGVSAREAALVARLGAEHACALEGWSRALGAAAEVRVVTATRDTLACIDGVLEYAP